MRAGEAGIASIASPPTGAETWPSGEAASVDVKGIASGAGLTSAGLSSASSPTGASDRIAVAAFSPDTAANGSKVSDFASATDWIVRASREATGDRGRGASSLVATGGTAGATEISPRPSVFAGRGSEAAARSGASG